MAEPTGQVCSDTAMAALQSGNTPEAALWFERAARTFLAERAPDRARSMLSNLGYARKLLGDLPGALRALDEAVSLLRADAPPQERGLVLLNRAGVMDRLADPRAHAAWMEAGACFKDHQPLMVLVCEAHAAGAAIAAENPGALDAARATIAGLGTQATPALTVGLLGAIGESAGAAGIPFLAQAVWLMRQRADAFNTSNVPFLVLLAERLGLTHALSSPLCALGLILAGLSQGTPEHGALMGSVVGLLHRVAAARAMSTDALLAELRAAAGPVSALAETLHALVPPELWLIDNR